MSIYVIGADRGFATFGYTVFELIPMGERVVEVQVIETKKDNKKKETLAAADNHRRTQEIYMILAEVFIRYGIKAGDAIVAAAAEAASLPRNAGSSYKVGRADGVWSSILAHHSTPLVEASPQAIKKKLCGKSSAPKSAVAAVLERRYPGQFDTFKDKYAAGKWEHGFDAAATVVACLDGDVMKMARQLVKR